MEVKAFWLNVKKVIAPINHLAQHDNAIEKISNT